MGFLTFLFIGVALILFITTKAIVYFKKRNEKKAIENFKKNSIKIPVKLNEIKVLSNSWTEEIEKYRNENDAGKVLYNRLTNNDHKNVDYVNVNLNRLIYEFSYDQRRYLYTSILDIEKEKLKTWFVFHKETTLFLDPGTGEMYLDLEFME